MNSETLDLCVKYFCNNDLDEAITKYMAAVKAAAERNDIRALSIYTRDVKTLMNMKKEKDATGN